VLTQQQFAKLVRCIEEGHVRVIVMVSMCLGLRFSEVLALQWPDIDWRGRLISISRGIVQGRIGPVKTEYSDAPAPLDPALAKILRDWKGKADRTDPGRWVFGSPFKGFAQPYFPTAVRRHIQAAADKAGLGEILKGEPTKVFRHSYRAWLGTTNTPIAVIKDLMRHADIRTAFNVYGNGLEQPMRGANSKVVRMAVRAG
jgi:integrase